MRVASTGVRPLVAWATIAVGLRRELEERALIVDRTCFTVLQTSARQGPSFFTGF